jgi:hypothetical protein
MSELRRLALDRAYSASDPLDREFFLRWHLQLSIDQSLMSLQAIDFRTLVECALQGARNDRSWFGKFSRAVVRGVNKSVRMRLQPKAEKEKSDVL